jgi:hypothetical protein
MGELKIKMKFCAEKRELFDTFSQDFILLFIFNPLRGKKNNPGLLISKPFGVKNIWRTILYSYSRKPLIRLT